MIFMLKYLGRDVHTLKYRKVRCMDGRLGGRMSGQVDGQTGDGWTDAQICVSEYRTLLLKFD